uniref:NADH-ubiquinone oxidoreductase chain 4L n=2 Tax=Thoradonta TaxID=510020 RepID=A0A343QNR5_9ORTH|nr:NADH dehydrogenase subunit 4L [Thoradonta yunnana]ATU74761.1 NADH dehydrogenase subunit 4L [Thoradonta obtusilobata]QPK42108.1 NADH dehydrogenase subunit 4L [Thoradonta nodulosa]WCF77159.1 NADH dehydrogenase subunit 4L [Thoradonta yunnana]WCK12009.1 NADH dehydrogenase subunit 4L [Thoradonta yunnana]
MFIIYFFVIFMSGFYVFCSVRKHMLLILLSLEYMVLSLFFLVYIYFIMYGYSCIFLLIYLIFSVCEGALGLAILVSMIRSSGSDYVFSSYLFLC